MTLLTVTDPIIKATPILSKSNLSNSRITHCEEFETLDQSVPQALVKQSL